MPQSPYTIIRVPRSNLEEAHELIGRMTAIGVPRDHMNVTPHMDDTYHVAIHVRASEQPWIEKVLAEEASGSEWRVPTSALMLIAGGAAALGAGAWALWSFGPGLRSRLGLSAHRPRRERDRAELVSLHDDDEADDPGAEDRENGAPARHSRETSSPNTGFSSLNPPHAPSGIASGLQPGGLLPGGGPGASVGSIGTGGGQTTGQDTGWLKRGGV